MDPVTLEVTITDALRRPLGQIDPITLADLLALVSADIPAQLKPAVRRFCDRIAREIGDIPDGPPWATFLAELDELPPERVPVWLREQVQIQGAREDRLPASKERAGESLDRWAGVEPEPFTLGSRGVKVARGGTPPPKPSDSLSRKARQAARSRPESSSSPKPRRARSSSATVDPEREQLISQLVQERLAKYAANGLAELVLVVGIPKQAAGEQPGITGAEVLATLKDLESKGLIRRSGKRWILERQL